MGKRKIKDFNASELHSEFQAMRSIIENMEDYFLFVSKAKELKHSQIGMLAHDLAVVVGLANSLTSRVIELTEKEEKIRGVDIEGKESV